MGPTRQLLRLRRGAPDLLLDGDSGLFGGLECLRDIATQNKDKTGRFVFAPSLILRHPLRISIVDRVSE